MLTLILVAALMVLIVSVLIAALRRYDANNYFDQDRQPFYAEPEALVSAGLIYSQRDRDGREQHTYTVTPAGEAGLRTWLREPTNDPGFLHHYFAGLVASPERSRIVDKRRAIHKSRLAEYERIELLLTDRPEWRYALSATRVGVQFERECLDFWADVDADDRANGRSNNRRGRAIENGRKRGSGNGRDNDAERKRLPPSDAKVNDSGGDDDDESSRTVQRHKNGRDRETSQGGRIRSSVMSVFDDEEEDEGGEGDRNETGSKPDPKKDAEAGRREARRTEELAGRSGTGSSETRGERSKDRNEEDTGGNEGKAERKDSSNESREDDLDEDGSDEDGSGTAKPRDGVHKDEATNEDADDEGSDRKEVDDKRDDVGNGKASGKQSSGRRSHAKTKEEDDVEENTTKNLSTKGSEHRSGNQGAQKKEFRVKDEGRPTPDNTTLKKFRDQAKKVDENWSRDDLYELSRSMNIEGRSSMNKDELIDAIRRE